MEPGTDTTYIYRVLHGDTGAFKLLVEKYQNMVYTLAFKITGNREEAEDAAQEIFVKCYRHLRSYDGRASFSTWLYRITYNHCADVMKKRKRRWTENWDDVGEAMEAESLSIDEKIDLRDVRALLKDAIHRLPPNDQVIVTLCYYEGLSLREIAEVMGIRENNVKIKLYRIRSRLLELLQSKNEIISILNL